MLSPETGIVDSHGYMLALLGDIESNGGSLALNAPVLRGEALSGGGFEIEIGGEAPARLRCNVLVNSAGLGAQTVASSIVGVAETAIPPLVLAKGSYFSCSAKAPFTHLIYPAPVDGGLGVHLTLDLSGALRAGPDAQYVSELRHEVDEGKAASFARAVQRYLPELREEHLRPDYAGIRPKLNGPGEPPRDFVIAHAAEHGVPGLVNLIGIESPGLTATEAIAERVAAIVASA
jgi:L-2-hydroxyglutarate oxidase LhgO